MAPQFQYKIVSTAQMKELDRRAFEVYGIPSLILMEHAGAGVADIAEKHFKPKNILVICGKGNNGGDGFAAARHLFNRGYPVQVILTGDPDGLKADAKINFEILMKIGVPVIILRPERAEESVFSVKQILRTFGAQDDKQRAQDDKQKAQDDIRLMISSADLIIDALFGIGLDREVEEPYAGLIETVNDSRKPVLAVDIPSGLNSDTGEIMGVAVKAAATAALGLPKQGLYTRQGPLLAGQISIVDIGLPRQLLPPS